MELTSDEKVFYTKNLRLDLIGEAGQLKLKAAKVLILGAGGLGSPALLYLATSGIGNIGIVDFDIVSISNLPRQILYSYSDIGKPKAQCAYEKIKEMNPFINVKYYNLKITEDNINGLIKDYDIILDSPDNFTTRYIIENACYRMNKIVVHASVSRFQGQVSVFTHESACYNCIFPTDPNEKDIKENLENKIFGPVTGVIGIIQAIECIKIILGIGEPLINFLLCYNALNQSVNKIIIEKDPECLICGRSDKKC